MHQTTNQDLGIEIGKSLAAAEYAQQSIVKVEKHLTDRMDRFETRIDGKFQELDGKMERAFEELKDLIQSQHVEITAIKIHASVDDSEKTSRKESRTHLISLGALLVSFGAAVAAFIQAHWK